MQCKDCGAEMIKVLGQTWSLFYEVWYCPVCTYFEERKILAKKLDKSVVDLTTSERRVAAINMAQKLKILDETEYSHDQIRS